MDGSQRSEEAALLRQGGVARTGDASLGDQAAPEETPSSPPQSLLGELSGSFASARQVISDFLELLSLEARRAGLTLVWMLACGAIAAILVISAWLGFMAALALWIVSLGVPWVTAVIGISSANLLAAAIVASACMRMSRDLLFPATRRQLQAKATQSRQPQP